MFQNSTNYLHQNYLDLHYTSELLEHHGLHPKRNRGVSCLKLANAIRNILVSRSTIKVICSKIYYPAAPETSFNKNTWQTITPGASTDYTLAETEHFPSNLIKPILNNLVARSTIKITCSENPAEPELSFYLHDRVELL